MKEGHDELPTYGALAEEHFDRVYKFIYYLVKERGFTLEGAKTHLKENRQQALDAFEIISKLEAIKAQLIKIKSEI